MHVISQLYLRVHFKHIGWQIRAHYPSSLMSVWTIFVERDAKKKCTTMTHLKSSRDLQAQGRVDGAAKRGATNKKLKTRHVIMFLSARLVSCLKSEKRVKNLKQFKHSHMNDAVIVCARAELSSRQSWVVAYTEAAWRQQRSRRTAWVESCFSSYPSSFRLKAESKMESL